MFSFGTIGTISELHTIPPVALRLEWKAIPAKKVHLHLKRVENVCAIICRRRIPRVQFGFSITFWDTIYL